MKIQTQEQVEPFEDFIKLESVKESEQPLISNGGNIFSQLIEMLKSLFNFS